MDGFSPVAEDAAGLLSALRVVDGLVSRLFHAPVHDDMPAALLGEVALTWDTIEADVYGGVPALDKRITVSGTFRGERRDAIATPDQTAAERAVVARLAVAWATLGGNIDPGLKAAGGVLSCGRLLIQQIPDGGLLVTGSLSLSFYQRVSETEV